ncbi:MAG TPA: DUF2069 domain-containing protein [Pseudomonadales bacterium]|nr:DUF2069 domain-containing protein [Pseudomonadales bacterium]
MDVAAKARLAWQLTFTLYVCLLVSLTLDHTILRHTFYWPVWLMQTAPLLLILPGLLQHRARSGTWLCFMILFHLMSAIDHAATTEHTVIYSSIAILTLALFTTSLLFVRWQRMQDPL